MSKKTLLTWPLPLLLAACASGGLEPLLVDGHELHPSLTTRSLEDLGNLRASAEMTSNPFLSSTDPEFIQAIARRSTQGQGLAGRESRAALYSVYFSDKGTIGIYGLEAASTSEADEIERTLRSIWAYGASLGMMRVHRDDRVLVVVWVGDDKTSDWEEINANVVSRLAR